MERTTLYTPMTRTVEFEGTIEEAKAWLLAQADTLPNGTKIFRTWQDADGDYYYDVGNVYCSFNKVL